MHTYTCMTNIQIICAYMRGDVGIHTNRQANKQNKHANIDTTYIHTYIILHKPTPTFTPAHVHNHQTTTINHPFVTCCFEVGW